MKKIAASNPKPVRWRRKTLLALFAAIAALAGGAQALAPAPAAADMNQDGCKSKVDFGYFEVCLDEEGGGTGGGGSVGTGGSSNDGDGGAGPSGGGSGGQTPGEQPGEVIVLPPDTKSCNSKILPPGYICPDELPNFQDAFCTPKPGYICPTYCPSDRTWKVESCDPGPDREPTFLPPYVGAAGTSKCGLSKGRASFAACVHDLSWDQCNEYFPAGPKRDACRQVQLKKMWINQPKCRDVETHLARLRQFKSDMGATPKGWKQQGYLRKEEHLEDQYKAMHCDQFGPEA